MPERHNPWPEIDAWLAANAPRVARALCPPATAGTITHAQRELDRPLPASLLEMYRAHDGVVDEEHAWFGAVRLPRGAIWVRSMWMLSLDEALAQWRLMRDLGGDWRDAVLPIAMSASGDLVVVSLDAGTCGAWDHETGETTPLGDFGAWMSALADDIRAGLIVSGSEDDDEDPTLTLLAEPPPPAHPPVLGPDRPARVLVEILVERRFIALADGANVESLVAALSQALSDQTSEARASGVFSVLDESAVVEEIFAGDDEIEDVVEELG